jgi:hypothetical protein
MKPCHAKAVAINSATDGQPNHKRRASQEPVLLDWVPMHPLRDPTERHATKYEMRGSKTVYGYAAGELCERSEETTIVRRRRSCCSC